MSRRWKMGKTAKKETLAELRDRVRKNFALCYWNEDSLTEDGGIPKEHTIEPIKFLERVVNACRCDSEKERVVWMVTIEGSSHGDYENNASSCLFGSLAEARKFVKEDIRECILQDKIVDPNMYKESEMREAIRDNVRWFGRYKAQYRDCGSVTDWKIEKVAVPPEKERS
jgi:hypothetical protein